MASLDSLEYLRLGFCSTTRRTRYRLPSRQEDAKVSDTGHVVCNVMMAVRWSRTLLKL
jgi:hypothetical protein